MDLHGAPLSRTWVDLGRTVKPGDTAVTLSEPVTGWKVGDEVILTGSKRPGGSRFRNRPDNVSTEERKITKIDAAAKISNCAVWPVFAHDTTAVLPVLR